MLDRAFVEEIELDPPNKPIKAHESPIFACVWLNHLIIDPKVKAYMISAHHDQFTVLLLNCHYVNHLGNAV